MDVKTLLELLKSESIKLNLSIDIIENLIEQNTRLKKENDELKISKSDGNKN